MKALRKKLHNSRGETLVEVLVSILICTLSVALLFSGIMASARINKQAEISDDGFFDVLDAAEEKTGTPFKSGSHINVSMDDASTKTFTVNYYGNDTIHSYKLAPKSPILGGENGEGGDSAP